LAQCVNPHDANKSNYFQHPSIGGGYSGAIKWARVLTQALGGSQGAILCQLVGPSVCHRLAQWLAQEYPLAHSHLPCGYLWLPRALCLLVTTQGLAGGCFWAMRSLDLDKYKEGRGGRHVTSFISSYLWHTKKRENGINNSAVVTVVSLGVPKHLCIPVTH
jgi:hypothetical protein